MEIAAQAFGDDRDQAKLEIRSPVEWPEEQVPGALNGGRNSIDGGDDAHSRPFLETHNVV
jgi:hypothetical protein